jgi:uncharacterized Zn finger protein
MKLRSTAWRTDEPCPSCGNDLTVVDEGGPVLRAECRMCGHAEPWDTSNGTCERDW